MNWHVTLWYTVKPPEGCYYFSDVTTESLHIREINTPFLRPTCGLSPGESADEDSHILALDGCEVTRHWPSSGCAGLMKHGMAPLQSQCLAFHPSKQGPKKTSFVFPFCLPKEDEDHSQPHHYHWFTCKPGLSMEQNTRIKVQTLFYC